MACLRAVKAAFLDERDAVVVGERIKHRGAHAAAGGGAGDQQAVDTEQHEVTQQRGAEKTAGLLLGDHDVLRRGGDVVNDPVAVDVGRGIGFFIGTVVLPRPRPRIPVVLAPRAGGVDHRQAFRATRGHQLLDGLHTFPGILSAGVAPFLDGFKDGLGLVAAERVIDIDHKDGGALAEALPGTVAGGGENLFVAFGQELIPYGFVHVISP